MRKLSFLSIIILSLSLILVSCSSPESFHPTLTVKSTKDDISFNPTTNGGTWFDKSTGGNSFLGIGNLEKSSSIDAIKVSCDSTLDLELSYSKDIESYSKDLEFLKVYSIEGNTSSNEELIEVETVNYTITTPPTPGEYSYVVETQWDETHCIRFIFKIETI